MFWLLRTSVLFAGASGREADGVSTPASMAGRKTEVVSKAPEDEDADEFPTPAPRAGPGAGRVGRASEGEDADGFPTPTPRPVGRSMSMGSMGLLTGLPRQEKNWRRAAVLPKR